MPTPLGPEERAALSALARTSIADALLGDGSLERALREFRPTPGLTEARASFVTLRSPDGGLRGCIGGLEPLRPLYLDVVEHARAAAFSDPRFPPVSADEFPSLDLHVTALTVPRPVAGPEEIVLGRHGVVFRKGPYRSVFLPQVAPEQGWNVLTLLEELARKAGLSRGDWRGAELAVFEGEEF